MDITFPRVLSRSRGRLPHTAVTLQEKKNLRLLAGITGASRHKPQAARINPVIVLGVSHLQLLAPCAALLLGAHLAHYPPCH